MPDSFTTWNSRPLFLSSTFLDMHAERDLLRIEAFPKLEEKLKERRHYLETVDLRQGIETADISEVEAREKKVLQVCLNELHRSLPFFLGFLGDRYGWMPPKARIEAAAQSAGFPEEVAGKSVTELEMLYASLENRVSFRGWIYIRDLEYSGMPDEVRVRFDDRFAGNTEAADMLDALKLRLRRLHPDRVITYCARWDAERGRVVDPVVGHGADQVLLANSVFTNLWSDMGPATEEWLQAAPKSWQAADALLLEDFVEGRIRGFVERERITQPLIDLAVSPSKEGSHIGICLVGESGSGKSSIFGWVHRELQNRRKRGESLLILSHAAGIYPRSASVESTLQRWIHELAVFLEVDDPFATAHSLHSALALEPEIRATQPDETEEIFASLLGRAALTVRVVILIDALNQFERTTRGRYLTWLPKLWPDNARLIATAIPGTESEVLGNKAGLETTTLSEITTAEAEKVAIRFYERFRREVPKKALGILLNKRTSQDSARRACGNPLWLELALQEMNLLEADDFQRADQEFAHLEEGQRMEEMQALEAERLPSTLSGIYWELLARSERYFGQHQTSGMMSLIALGRSGWRESDLEAMMPMFHQLQWDDLAFAGLRRVLGHHLVQRGSLGQWDCFHAQLRDSVLSRYLYDEGLRCQFHRLIADHLERLPAQDLLRNSEMVVHLIGLGSLTRAAKYLALFRSAEPVLVQTAKTMAELSSVDSRIEAFVIGLPEAEGVTEHESWRCASMLQSEGIDAFEREMPLTFCLRVLRSCAVTMERLAASDPSNSAWQRDLSINQVKIGDVLLDQGKLGEALECYYQSLEVRERLAASDPSNATWQRDRSIGQEAIGDVLLVQGKLGEALEFYHKSLETAKSLAASDPSNATWQRDLSVGQEKIGDVLLDKGMLEEALEIYRKSMVVVEQLVASDPSDVGWQRHLSVSLNSVGDVLHAQGRYREALDSYRRSMAIVERLAASDPSDVTWQRALGTSAEKMGDVLRSQGKLGGALEFYRQSLAVAERLAASDPSSVGSQRDLSLSLIRTGDVLLDQGNFGQALESYRQSLAVIERLAATDSSHVGWQRQLNFNRKKIGDLLLDQGRHTDALEFYRQSLAVIERLAASDPSHAEWQRDLRVCQGAIGDVLLAQRRPGKALEFYRQSLDGAERLATSDPSNATWQRDLSICLENIGDVLRLQRKLRRALEFYRQSMAVAKRLAASDPSHFGWQRDLSLILNKIGDVLVDQGNLRGARDFYRQAMKIRESLMDGNPSHFGLMKGLVSSHHKLAALANQIGFDSDEDYHLSRCKEILREMLAMGMHLDPPLQQLMEELKADD